MVCFLNYSKLIYYFALYPANTAPSRWGSVLQKWAAWTAIQLQAALGAPSNSLSSTMIQSRARTQPRLQVGSHPTRYTTTLLLFLDETATPSSSASTNSRQRKTAGLPSSSGFQTSTTTAASSQRSPVWINYWCQCIRSKKDWILLSAQLNLIIFIYSIVQFR